MNHCLSSASVFQSKWIIRGSSCGHEVWKTRKSNFMDFVRFLYSGANSALPVGPSLFFKKMSVLIHLTWKETKELDHIIWGTFSQGKTWDIRQGGRDLWGGGQLLRQRKSMFKKRRCYWERWNHLINQEREAELSPAGVQSKPEQLWVLLGGPNPLVAPPGAWKPGGESPFVRTKATLTRFHCDKKWEGCFVGLKNSQQEVRIRCPFIFQALH